MPDTETARLIDINGDQLYIKWNNDLKGRPTLVFLHDSLGSVQLWRDFPYELAEKTNCNVLVYDRLGYGKSAPMPTSKRDNNYLELQADVLAALINQLDIQDAILFGHSDGGSIALITAAKYPERVKAVVSEAGHLFVEEVTLKGIREAMEAYTTTDLKQKLEKYHGDKVETLFKAWTETWTSNHFKNWNIEHFLPKITCPILVIQGENDEYGTLRQVEQTVTHVSGPAQKFIMPNAGHTPHKEAKEPTLLKAAEFINSL
mgnify:CR=1 FL=1